MVLKSNTGYYFPMELRWFGYILLIISVFYLFQGNWILPLAGFFAGNCLSWSKNGVKIDFDQKRSKEYFGLFGMELGKWQDLPELERIVLVKSNYSRVMGSKGSSSKFRFTEFRALLVGEDFKMPVAVTKTAEKILTAARLVSEKMNIPILDCTKKPPAWVK